jgi:YVTN family beta-propeller protein
LEEKEGSLLAIDLDPANRKLLKDPLIPLPSFCGRVAVDSGRKRIYVSDRSDDALLVFEYRVPGTDGRPIDIEPIDVELPAEDTVNGIETDEGPFGVLVASGAGSRSRVFVTNNQSGSVSIIDSATLGFSDRNPDDERRTGLPLVSAANAAIADQAPGSGASYVGQAPAPDDNFLYITSISNNLIYVVDRSTESIEAMLDLSRYFAGVGMRGMAFTSDGRLIVAHEGERGMAVLDVSGVTDDGIPGNIVDAPLLSFVPLQDPPEDVILSADGSRVFVSHSSSDRVTVVDLVTGQVERRVEVGVGSGQFVPDPARAVVYVLNFGSDSVSVLDEITGSRLGTIE